MLARKKLILIALESPSGTKAAGTVSVLAEDLEMTPTGEFVQRNGSGVYLGNTRPGVVTLPNGKCSFSVELRSSAAVTITCPKIQYKEIPHGSRNGLITRDVVAQCNISSGDDFITIAKGAGTLGSGIDELLKSSGFVLASTTYSPHSVLANQVTLSIDCYEDGKKKSMAGAQGKMTIEAEYGKRVMLKFEFSGVNYTEGDATMPAFDPGTTAVLKAAGGTFTIGAAAKKISKLTLEVGQQVEPRPDFNAASGAAFYSVVDYDTTAAFDLEEQLAAAYDVHALWRAGTEAALVFAAA